MKLLTRTPIIYDLKKDFPRNKENKPYLPGNVLRNAIVNAAIYYYAKKDKEIENSIKEYVLKRLKALRKNLNPEEIVDEIKNRINRKYSVLNYLTGIPEKIYLPGSMIFNRRIAIFNLELLEWEDSFYTEIFSGTIEINVNSIYFDKLKPIGHSYCEGLCHWEISMLKDHPIRDIFYLPLLNNMKKWEIPLRVGIWTDPQYKYDPLFLWRIKEIRKELKKKNVIINPKRVIYLPKEKCTVGWCDLKK